MRLNVSHLYQRVLLLNILILSKNNYLISIRLTVIIVIILNLVTYDTIVNFKFIIG